MTFFRSGILLILATAISSFRLFAGAVPVGVPPEIEDWKTLATGTEPWHAVLMPYANEAEAVAARRDRSSLSIRLNGDWKFMWSPRPEARPADFYRDDFDDSGWKTIPVPSNWQTYGYGTPFYRNAGYTFKIDPPHVMEEPPKQYTAYAERNPVGSYRRTFTIPTDWDGRHIFLNFAGVDSGFFLWINGKKAGWSTNSRNMAEFDITPYVKPGENRIAVEVYQYCVGSYLEDMDMWRLSGIFRDVTLWSAPPVHVRDFHVNPMLDKNYRDGVAELSAKIKNYGRRSAEARRLTFTLYDDPVKMTRIAESSVIVPALGAGEEREVSLRLDVKTPAHWTAETPALYTAVLRLDGETPEFLSARVGFRNIVIRGREVLVNGVPIKLRGVNRHEHEPETGHAVTLEGMLKDIAVIKRGNANHVRTSHYTDDPRWYELCDEYGLWVVAEANVEAHGMWYGRKGSSDVPLSGEPFLHDAILDRQRANVENLKNHPSILFWSLGNEAGESVSLEEACALVKRMDPSRPVHYRDFGRVHGVGKDNPADVDSQTYTRVAALAGIAQDRRLTKPFYMNEYAHSMFNSSGALGEYDDMIDAYPALLGGAIWEFADQGYVNRRDPSKPAFLAYGGGFGEYPNDRYFIHKGVVFSDRSPKPAYAEMAYVFRNIMVAPTDLAKGEIEIRNRYSFLNLDAFAARWSVLEDGIEIASGDLPMPVIPPGTHALAKVPLPELKPEPGATYFLKLTFAPKRTQPWIRAGETLVTEQFELPLSAPAHPSSFSASEKTRLTEEEHEMRINGPRFEFTWDKSTGDLTRLAYDGKNLIAEGGAPRLHLWRAPHQTDDIWAYVGWRRYGLNNPERKLVSMIVSRAAGVPSLTVTTDLVGDVSPGSESKKAVVFEDGKATVVRDDNHDASQRFVARLTTKYTVSDDGRLRADSRVTFSGPKLPLARIGIRFGLDKSLARFDFLGRGPMENYADRKRGFPVGFYGSSVADQMTPYAKPMECGNHEDVRWGALTTSLGTGLLVKSESGALQMSALPYSDEEMDPVAYRYQLPESKSTWLVLSEKTLGVGSAGCGPRPEESCIPYPKETTFSYTIGPIAEGTPRESLPRLARNP